MAVDVPHRLAYAQMRTTPPGGNLVADASPIGTDTLAGRQANEIAQLRQEVEELKAGRDQFSHRL